MRTVSLGTTQTTHTSMAEKEGSGPLIAIIIIVIILALGGLYYLVNEIHNIRESQSPTTATNLSL